MLEQILSQENPAALKTDSPDFNCGRSATNTNINEVTSA